MSSSHDHSSNKQRRRWSPGTSEKLAAAVKKLRGSEIFQDWRDPTKGSKVKRLRQLTKCGKECYALPDPENPKYPVCDVECKPVCNAISAAMTYAKIYNNTEVRRNLKAALAACHDIRRENAEDA